MKGSGFWLAPTATVIGLITFFALPSIRGTSLKLEKRRPYSEANWRSYELSQIIEQEMGANLAQFHSTPSSDKGRDTDKLLRDIIRKDEPHRSWREPMTNLFTGELVRFEASPGNVVLRPATHGKEILMNSVRGEAAYSYDLIWHDFDGAEAITNSVIPGIPTS